MFWQALSLSVEFILAFVVGVKSLATVRSLRSSLCDPGTTLHINQVVSCNNSQLVTFTSIVFASLLSLLQGITERFELISRPLEKVLLTATLLQVIGIRVVWVNCLFTFEVVCLESLSIVTIVTIAEQIAVGFRRQWVDLIRSWTLRQIDK